MNIINILLINKDIPQNIEGPVFLGIGYAPGDKVLIADIGDKSNRVLAEINHLRPFWLQIGDEVKTINADVIIIDIVNDNPEPIIEFKLKTSGNNGVIRNDIFCMSFVEFINR